MERTRLVLIISTSSGTTKQGVQLRVLAFQFLRQHRISRISTCTSRVAPRIANSPAEVVARTRGSRDPRCTTPRCVRAAINERRRCQLPRRLYRVPYQQLWGLWVLGEILTGRVSCECEIFACHFGKASPFSLPPNKARQAWSWRSALGLPTTEPKRIPRASITPQSSCVIQVGL